MLTIGHLQEMACKVCDEAAGHKEPRGLYEPIEYMMSIGGKRLRPVMCLMAYNLWNDSFGPEILGPAVAMEMFHEFTLLHDDIMDKSDMRRRVPTVHAKWNDNTAILSGDTMALEAYEFLAQAPFDKLKDALSLFTATAIQVCEGQQYDMDFENRPNISMDEYLGMIGLKTAVLLAGSIKMGALIAGASEVQQQALYDYAYQLGLAFQITDDYLDCYGDEKTFGKKIGGDIMEGKKSWLLVRAMEKSSGEAADDLSAAFAVTGRAARIEAVLNVYKRLNIKNDAEEAIKSYESKALAALEPAGLDAAQIAQFQSFAQKLLKRDK